MLLCIYNIEEGKLQQIAHARVLEFILEITFVKLKFKRSAMQIRENPWISGNSLICTSKKLFVGLLLFVIAVNNNTRHLLKNQCMHKTFSKMYDFSICDKTGQATVSCTSQIFCMGIIHWKGLSDNRALVLTITLSNIVK